MLTFPVQMLQCLWWASSIGFRRSVFHQTRKQLFVLEGEVLWAIISITSQKRKVSQSGRSGTKCQTACSFHLSCSVLLWAELKCTWKCSRCTQALDLYSHCFKWNDLSSPWQLQIALRKVKQTATSRLSVCCSLTLVPWRSWLMTRPGRQSLTFPVPNSGQ